MISSAHRTASAIALTVAGLFARCQTGGVLMQHITTRYHGPTNTKGSRISARAEAKTRYFHRDCAESIEEAHKHAAEALANELWSAHGYKLTDMVGYQIDGNSWMWFFADDPFCQRFKITPASK
jgi:hypothetical protein